MIVDNTDINTNVQYYDDGWRCGYLEEIKGKFAVIKPVNRLASKEPHAVKIQMLEYTKDGQEVVCVKKIKETKNDKEEVSSKAGEEASPKVSKGQACSC